MRFKLFLNKLSASQTISESKRENKALNCYGMCNPYNSRRLTMDDSPRISMNDLYLAMKAWRIRKEGFGHLVYDPGNSRIYEVDSEGESFLRDFCNAQNLKEFAVVAESSPNHRSILEQIQTECI
ncbi:MAG: hypothetical protein SV686_00360 [Thermodesulfobacteriota bacterium]|nr:hypothetical protein [Thermodesulfobacteriota bacterium]